MSGSAFAVTHHAFSSGAGRTSDGNGSHASTLKSPSYTKSVSWQHYPGMAAFAAHAADDVKLKATKTNVAFSDFTPTEYSTKGKPNIIVLTMDDRKRKLTAVCSHQTRIGNLDAHLI